MRTQRKPLIAGAAVVAVTVLGTAGAALAQATPTPQATTAPSTGTDVGDGDGEAADDAGDQDQQDGKALTGAVADKVAVAAKAKVPTATLDRVEADGSGTYEAHMTRPDGTEVDVQVGPDFTVSAVDTDGTEDSGTSEAPESKN